MRLSKLLSLLLLLTFLLPAWGDAPDVSRALVVEHRAMHWIVTEDDSHTAGCTATAVGPHALLTAEHCLLHNPDEDGKKLDGSPVKLFVDEDGKPAYLSFTPYTVLGVLKDGSDHVLLLTKGPVFKDVAPLTVGRPYQGEPILWFGNPGGVRDMLREGYVMGVKAQPAPFSVPIPQPLWFVGAPAIPGDSGSAVIDAETGTIVGVVTYGINDGEFMGMFELHFSPEQLAMAQNYDRGSI